MAWYKSAGVQSVVVMASRIGAGLLNFVLFAVAARAMGGDGFGSFSIAFSAVMLMGGLGSFGQQAFLVKEVPRSRVNGDAGRERGAYAYAGGSVLTVGLAAAAVAAFWVSAKIEGAGLGVLLGAASLTMLYAVSQVTIGALRVEGFVVLGIFTRDFLWRLLSVVLILAAAWRYGHGGDFVSPGQGIVLIAVALVPVIALHVQLLRRAWAGRWSGTAVVLEVGEWTKLSLGLAIVGAVSGADLYLFTIGIGDLVSPLVAGAVFAAIKSVDLISLFLLATGLVAGPDVSALIAAGHRDRIQRKLNALLAFQGLPALAASLLLLVAAPYVLWLFDPGYAAYSTILRVLVGAMLVNVVTGVTNLLLQLSGLHWYQVSFQVGSLALALAVLPFFVDRFGPVGVAWCYLIRQLIWNGCAVFVLRRKAGLDPSLLALAEGPAGTVRIALDDALAEMGMVARRVAGKGGSRGA